ncbi:MAG: hypothetical protein QXZ09_08585 [Candidatus Methanomethylicaceae archaeon]
MSIVAPIGKVASLTTVSPPPETGPNCSPRLRNPTVGIESVTRSNASTVPIVSNGRTLVISAPRRKTSMTPFSKAVFLSRWTSTSVRTVPILNYLLCKLLS